MNKFLETHWNELRDNFGNICHWTGCTTRDNLEFAHRLPTNLSGRGRGKLARYYDIIKHPVNYVLLCYIHHAKMDGRNLKEELDLG